MKTLPLSIGTIHFVGIGGIGMSGIAEVLHNLKYKVQGSDAAESANVKRLRDLGIPVMVGHAAENIGNASVVVYSSAVKADNPELAAARTRLIPVIRRAEMLGEIMRLRWAIAIGGTHGKTTTTSLIGAVLETAQFDPTVINGGIINAYGTNTRLGDGDWIVVEADESDGTFVKLPITVAVVTNIDPEHLDHYGTFDKVKDAFVSFVQNVPFYGFAMLCIDHPEVQAMISHVAERRIVTYGMSPQADVRAVNVRLSPAGSEFDVELTDRVTHAKRRIEDVRLSMVGQHNAQNALAAIGIAQELGISDDVLKRSLAGFKGVKRRFTVTGVVDGITVIDDYGHHPVEIAAVMAAARRSAQGRVIAIVQPHRFTRLQSLFAQFCTCFNEADTVIVADVYPAGEAPIPGISRDALVEGLRTRGHRSVVSLPSPKDLADIVAGIADPGDFVVCVGAGSITAWANALPAELQARRAGPTAASTSRRAGGSPP
jgi:UDP-N-acetylmuramate--alanine ligase